MTKRDAKFKQKNACNPLVGLGARLAILRTEQNLTQPEFARALGVSSAAYNAYENGNRGLPVSALMEIGTQFGTSLDWLVLGKGIKHDKDRYHEFETFCTSLMSYIADHNITLRPERRDAIISRWSIELQAGRVISTEDVLIWIDLMKE